MIDGNRIVNKLVKLDEVKTMKDVKPLTYASFPGPHCPLFGSALVLKDIRDAMFMVIGTDECSYYTKQMAMGESYGGVDGRCVSVILDQHDITFGCDKKITAAFKELMAEYKPKAIFFITTCVVELIGDDVKSLGENLSEEYEIPVLTVKTEHFKCENHIPGFERTLTACIDIMDKVEKSENLTVNILGQRLGKFEDTELYSILEEEKIEINLMLPGCLVEDIKRARRGHINIVANPIGLPLAKKMKSKFGIPYIIFDKFVSLDKVMEAYNSLFDLLQIEVPNRIKEKYIEATEAIQKGKRELEGVKYIFGNTPFHCFEVNSFMSKLGMVPQLIQTANIAEEDRVYIEEILKYNNPYITKNANIAPLQGVYDVLKPDLYLGHEYAVRLAKKGIAIVKSDSASSMLGLEVIPFLVNELIRAYNQAKEYQGGL